MSNAKNFSQEPDGDTEAASGTLTPLTTAQDTLSERLWVLGVGGQGC